MNLRGACQPAAPDERGDPAAQLADRRFREALVTAIANLPQREQYVMSMY